MTQENAEIDLTVPKKDKTGKIRPLKLKDALVLPYGDTYIGLQVAVDWNEKKKCYDPDEAYPRLVGIMEGEFANLPTDPEFWAALSPFATKLSTVLENLQIKRPKTVIDDLDVAMDIMDQFRK